MKFQCDCCGICCKNIKHIPQLSTFDRGDGVCLHLKSDNLCAIYATRPEICNVEAMYKKHFATIYTKETFYELNNKACAALKSKSNLFN